TLLYAALALPNGFGGLPMDILVPLTENHEYKRVYARGKSAVRPALVLYCLRNKKVKQARVGITASKKIGNAVKRNRARRLLRESIRALYPQLKPGYDFVLVSRGRTPFVNYQIVSSQLKSALEELGVLVALPKDKNNSAKTAENDSERTSETGEETASVTKEELS
ncbi:ribonuclease P protein component, partial [Hominenteromicrobium sp.]|uniref:ribonuclease P protein component n=2 Tax=Hominenteromicrobium sp. TaxID=3073581 RepID=UPI003A928A01